MLKLEKSFTLRTKIVFIFCSVTIAMVLFFSYRVVNNAMNKILVINEGGEFVHFKAMQTDKLFESLLKVIVIIQLTTLTALTALQLKKTRLAACSL